MNSVPAGERLASRWRDYVYLTRLHRPIGIFLLLWPTLWALWIAADGRPDPVVLLVLVLGTVLMRSAGCIINDFADRDFDPHVKRTRDRPLAARRISPYGALLLFGALLLASFVLVLQLNRLTIALSFIGALLAVSYPFFKRFFPAPQFYLGVAFGWGVPMAWAAQSGAVARTAWVMLLAAIVWAAVYDTFYAMVDRDDDAQLGLRSTALLFGEMDRAIIGIMQLLMLFGLALVGRAEQLGGAYWAGLLCAGALFALQLWSTRDRDRDACFRAFLNNHWVGFVIFAGIALDFWQRTA
ncbi:MAG: 4-hydroxybenzoate octaprenyltransferase [Steroidobacteraceae bacterium]